MMTRAASEAQTHLGVNLELFDTGHDGWSWFCSGIVLT